MNASTEHTQQATPKKSEGLTIRIPKPSLPGLQGMVIILLLVVGVVQAVQIYGLQRSLSSTSLTTNKPAVVAPAANTGTSGGASSLPSMVGGC